MSGEVRCPYCSGLAELVDGRVLFGAKGNAADLYWRCAPCDAHVRCHRGSQVPLGNLADARLRELRLVAHTAFDRLWQEYGNSRDDCYRWMGRVLGLQDWVKDAHIAMLTQQQCEALIDHCRRVVALGGVLD